MKTATFVLSFVLGIVFALWAFTTPTNSVAVGALISSMVFFIISINAFREDCETPFKKSIKRETKRIRKVKKI